MLLDIVKGILPTKAANIDRSQLLSLFLAGVSHCRRTGPDGCPTPFYRLSNRLPVAFSHALCFRAHSMVSILLDTSAAKQIYELGRKQY